MIKFILSKALRKARLASVRRSFIHATAKVEAGSQIYDVTMGRHSFCGYDCDLNNVEVGPFCSIASNVIIGGGEHPTDWVSTSPVFYEGRDSIKAKFSDFPRSSHERTIIKADVWIGRNALVKAGVHVGVGSVIAMGAVVTKDVPPYSIVGGVPAKVLKYRFAKDICLKLEKTKWWLLDDDKLAIIAQDIKEPAKFLKRLEGVL